MPSPPHYIHNFWNLDYYLIWQKMGAGSLQVTMLDGRLCWIIWVGPILIKGSRGKFDAEEKQNGDILGCWP